MKLKGEKKKNYMYNINNSFPMEGLQCHVDAGAKKKNQESNIKHCRIHGRERQTKGKKEKLNGI